jgi:hypothetical protein
MRGVFLSSLRKLLNDIECGELTDINEYLSDCWKELSLREKDSSISREILSKNREILEKLTQTFQEHKERPLSEEKLHLVKSIIYGEPAKLQYAEKHPNLSEISELKDLLEEIERKMKKRGKP